MYVCVSVFVFVCAYVCVCVCMCLLLRVCAGNEVSCIWQGNLVSSSAIPLPDTHRRHRTPTLPLAYQLQHFSIASSLAYKKNDLERQLL